MADFKYFISCDWGNSSLRLRLVDHRKAEVCAEHYSSKGVAVLYDEWQDSGHSGEWELHRRPFLMGHLQRELDSLQAIASIHLAGLPVVASGPASSSVGIEMLPYAICPFALEGSDAVYKIFGKSEHLQHDLLLFSGVRTEKSILRGEETQLLGLVRRFPRLRREAVMVIFPGTHAIHVQISGGVLTDFHNYMTGELFNLLQHHGLLKSSLVGYVPKLDTPLLRERFSQGVRDIRDGGLLTKLFNVRAYELLGHHEPLDNTIYLSGLLIGSELRQYIHDRGRQLIFCAGKHLKKYYKLTVDVLGLNDRARFIEPDTVEILTVYGQLTLLEQLRPFAEKAGI